jgi:hypothetical protein
MFPTDFGVKGERSSTLDIKEEMWFPGSRLLSLPPESPYHTYRYPWEEDVSYWFRDQKVKGQEHWTSKLKYGLRTLDRYPYHLESPYHTYRLSIGGRCCLLVLGSKGERSTAVDIKVEIRVLDSRMLLFSPRVTRSHIQTTHGRKMFPIKFGVKKLKVKFTGHWSRNMVSRL